MADTAVASGWRGPVLEWRARFRGAVGFTQRGDGIIKMAHYMVW